VAPDIDFGDAPDIKAFLESFTPSLLYLYPTFVEAEITDQKALDSSLSQTDTSILTDLVPRCIEVCW
jgi:hypothetical protein